MKLLIVYHPLFYELGYPPLKERVGPAFANLDKKGYTSREGVEVRAPTAAPLDLVERVHTPNHVRDVNASGYFEVAMLSTGGVVEASRAVAGGEADNAFCFVGAAGHHASREGYWGFCFINDVGVAVTDLLESGRAGRVAVVDIDPHFGDGTRDILGPESRVLHVNFHSSFSRGRSQTGSVNVDVPLPFDAGDEVFLTHARAALERAAEFDPDLLYVIFGYDSHHEDYGAFRLTLGAYRRFAQEVRGFFPTGVCFVLSGGSGVEVGTEAIDSVIDVLTC